MSNRLLSAFELVPIHSHVIDVGADHGLFSLFLSQHGHKVLAIENKSGPYQTLLKATKDDDNIHCVMADGLDYLENDIDCCCILGMGGITIKEILEKNRDKLSQFETIIISPQSMFHLPICFLEENGFRNDDGKYIYEKKYYPILRFVKGNCDLDDLRRKYGPVMVDRKDPLLLEMLEKEKERLRLFSSYEESKCKLELLEKEIKEIFQ